MLKYSIETKTHLIAEMKQEVLNRLERAINYCIIAVQNDVNENLNGKVLNVRTGRLKNSIATRVKRENEIVKGEIGTNVRYGVLWEMGGTVAAHTIVPINAAALHFYVGGKEVFAKRANISARSVEPRPFLKPGLISNSRLIMQVLTRAITGS